MTGLALAGSSRLRLASFFILYFSQGLPIGFLRLVIPAWVAANGASAADVALILGATTLPWALKFVFAFLVDRYSFQPMGRRRSWILSAQIIIVAVLVFAAARSPEASDIQVLAAIGFILQACTSVHDVAIDGLAVDLIGADERPRMSAWMFGGQALGTAVAALLGGVITTQFGPVPAYLALALCFSALLFMGLMIRERAGEARFPWRTSEVDRESVIQSDLSWRGVLAIAFSQLIKPASLVFLPIAFLKGIQTGVFVGATPLISASSLNWQADTYGALAGAVTVVAAIIAMIVVGRVVARFGTISFLSATFGLFVLLDLVALSGILNWSSPAQFVAFSTIWVIGDVVSMTLVMAVALSLSDKRVGAIQFAIYMGLANLGNAAGASAIGLSDWLGGSTQVFAVTLSSHIILIGFTLFFLRSNGLGQEGGLSTR